MKISVQEETSHSSEKMNPISFDFSTGNKLFVNRHTNEVRLFDKNNEIQLSINITSNGLSVSMNAKELSIHAEELLSLSSRRINIAATDQLSICTEGHLVQKVEKDSLTEIGGTNKLLAQVQKITATLGNVEIKANDDVRLDGERVKLNCE